MQRETIEVIVDVMAEIHQRLRRLGIKDEDAYWNGKRDAYMEVNSLLIDILAPDKEKPSEHA